MEIANREMQIVKRFKSKRNSVFLVKAEDDKKYVLKKYRKRKFLEKEYEVIEILNKKEINVPKIINKYNDSILMEYIEGDTLLSYILKKEREKVDYDQLENVFQELFIWLNEFYNLFRKKNKRLIKSDINLRNFILNNSKGNRRKIYGLDFENPKKGNKEEDIGKMCAFMICYEPEFSSWKIGLVKRFFGFMNLKLKLDSSLTYKYYNEELNSIEKRRDLEIKKSIYEILQ